MTPITLASFWAQQIWHPLFGPGYQFWSGIGSGFSNPQLLVVLVIAWHLVRAHNCHARWCPRIARHPVEGTPYRTCRRHHPGLPRRVPHWRDIHAAHQLAGAGP